jgi:hypothetical protein
VQVVQVVQVVNERVTPCADFQEGHQGASDKMIGPEESRAAITRRMTEAFELVAAEVEAAANRKDDEPQRRRRREPT